MNFLRKWTARRRIGRVACAALIANELEHSDLRDRILTYLDDHGADDALRDAVLRELGRFRRVAENGMKEAALTDLHDGRLFFAEIQATALRKQRLLRASPTTEHSHPH
ncbi:hypothetical protein [Streptomyces sp. NPDC020667]|uniref:hypothetical protein n=1 Tax=Streptomyces sp. NPDC020667 TaxID=3154895 RepID=UPI003410BBE0